MQSRALTAILFAAGLLPMTAAQANPAMTTTPTTMRAGPSFHAAVVQSIPADAQIDVTGCGQMWCTASWRDRSGYVRVNAIAPGEGGPPPPAFAAPPVVVAPFFGWGWGWGWRHYYY